MKNNEQKIENLLIYGSIFDLLDDMTNEEAGLLFKALNDFRKGNEVSFEDRYLQGIWKGILPNLNKLVENYESKIARNRENGKKGGRPPKKQETQLETNTETFEAEVVADIQPEEKVSQIVSIEESIDIFEYVNNNFEINDEDLLFDVVDKVKSKMDKSTINKNEIKYVNKMVNDFINEKEAA